MSYPFNVTDAGRNLSKRPKQRNDCTVRALATARNMSYDEAYDTLAAAGRKCSNGMHLGDWLQLQSWAHLMSFPAVKGQRRMNPLTFCQQFPQGRYICKAAKHVYAVIDGVVHDDCRPRGDSCIYRAWRIDL